MDTWCAGSLPKLKVVYMPVVEDFGKGQFGSAPLLEHIYLPATPPIAKGEPFNTNVKTSLTIHVPTGSLTAYQNATNWSAAVDKYNFVEDAQ